MSKLIDGKKIAEKIKAELKQEISQFETKPGLAIILVGDDEASKLYVSLKKRACHEIGIDFHQYLFSAQTKEKEIIETINFLNADSAVSGLIVQLPLPPDFNEQKIINLIDPEKDADGFHPANLKLIQQNQLNNPPPLIAAILALIDETKESFKNKKSLIIANSKTFAETLKIFLASKAVQADYISPDEQNLKEKTLTADILITAAGRPKFITADMVKKDSIIIDVGTNRVANKTVGDVDPAVDEICAYRSPVPGGVGPVTVAMLLKNVLNLYKKQNR